MWKTGKNREMERVVTKKQHLMSLDYSHYDLHDEDAESEIRMCVQWDFPRNCCNAPLRKNTLR